MTKKRLVLKVVLATFLTLLLFAVGFSVCAHISFYRVGETGLPRIDIITDKRFVRIGREDYVDCSVSLSGAGEEFDFEALDAGIRGRGHSTWKLYPKKPYRIKFDEKTSLFGEKKNKSWVLLAMYNDFSYIKDRLAFTLADSPGTEDFVPSYNYVELYINGRYNGLYLLTDQVDENKGRCEVKEDFTEADTEVPFLLEIDDYAPEEGVEGVDYFNVHGRFYAVKYPEADERYTETQFDYIKNYIETVDALTRKSGVTLSELAEYIDIQSFMDYYIIEELMGQTEINFKSVYMSKAVGEKMKMGPIWDFDWSVGGPYLTKYKNINIDRIEGFCSGDNFFGNLYKGSPEFRSALSDRFAEIEDKLSDAIDRVEAEKALIAKAVRKDKIRWHLLHIDADFEERSDEVLDWVRRRILWMNSEIIIK